MEGLTYKDVREYVRLLDKENKGIERTASEKVLFNYISTRVAKAGQYREFEPARDRRLLIEAQPLLDLENPSIDVIFSFCFCYGIIYQESIHERR